MNRESGFPDQEWQSDEEVAAAIKKLAEYREPGESNNNLEEFAYLLSTRLGEHSIGPAGFALATTLTLTDLQRGIDGYNREPMNHRLVGMSDEKAREIYLAIPGLASSVFDKKFGDAVGDCLLEFQLISAEDLSKYESIKEAIDNIEDAYTKIVADAKQKVLALDWQHFGLDDQELEKLFIVATPIALRNAPYELPVNLLINEVGQQRGLLLEMLPSQKRKYEEDDTYWLALTADVVPGDFATFTRDHLLLKIPEMIAGIKNLDQRETFLHLTSNASMSSRLVRAAFRMDKFMQAHPEIMKP